MELKSDEIWEVFNGAKSFEEFQKNILQPIYLKPQIPEDIKAEIKVVEKLLLHSYFEYQFIDLALSQAIFTLEKCIRVRHKEISGKSSENITFFKLIDWCFDNNYFETENKDILNQLRIIRNGKVHSEQKSLGGIAFLKKVYTVFYLINDLYEDAALRILRKEVIKKLQPVLNNFLKDGGIVTIEGKRTIIFKSDIIFLNNKQNPETLTLVVWPIFDPAPYTKDKHYKPHAFEIEIEKWQLNGDKFSGFSTAGKGEIFITKISDEVNEGKFSNWRKEFYALRDFSLILFLTTELNDNFYSALRKFHSAPTHISIK